MKDDEVNVGCEEEEEEEDEEEQDIVVSKLLANKKSIKSNAAKNSIKSKTISKRAYSASTSASSASSSSLVLRSAKVNELLNKNSSSSTINNNIDTNNDNEDAVSSSTTSMENNDDGNLTHTTTTTATPPSSLPTSSPCREGASSEEVSEEDSVAEMDYMSEGSVGVGLLSGEEVSDGIASEDLPAHFMPITRLPPPLLPHSSNPRDRDENQNAAAVASGVGGSGVGVPLQSPLSVHHHHLQHPVSEHPISKQLLQQQQLQLLQQLGGSSSISADHQLLQRKPAAVVSASSNNDSEKNLAGGGSEGYCETSIMSSNQDQEEEPLAYYEDHRPMSLPQFRDPHISMWTASHAANCPTEDRSASLVNILLQPLPPNFDSETQLPTLEPDYKTLIRLNLWCVIDGHGGGCVATYASEVLLPHIAASVSRMLGCAIVDRGVCTVNGQLRDANALDLDGLIKTSTYDHNNRSGGGNGNNNMCNNPHSIQYRYERSDSEDEGDILEERETNTSEVDDTQTAVPGTAKERKQIASLVKAAAGSGGSVTSSRSDDGESRVVGVGGASSIMVSSPLRNVGKRNNNPDASVSSAKTSVKTAASPANREALVGTHSPQEVAAITRAITESFLAVDEGWINAIDPVATHQTSCQSNGRWNSGACALVVFTIQRLDWTSVSEPDRQKESRGPEKSRRNTSQNRDAARLRMLDYAARAKSASSMSTASSTSSLTTEDAVNASGLESEITETEGEDDRSYDANVRKRNPSRSDIFREAPLLKESLISPPGGCSCHCYRTHDAILYTAHVGDCRAVMLGSAPPRTIKVRDCSHQDTTDDESSHHSSDETECLSSSDHDADSSEDEDVELQREAASVAASSVATSVATSVANSVATSGSTTSAATSSYLNFPRRVVRQKSSRRRSSDDTSGPYIALPPLLKDEGPKTVEFDFETDISHREGRRSVGKDPSVSSGGSSNDSFDLLPLVNLPPSIRPIDLTTDHSAYNPAEVTAVLRRCNNAPRAISAGVGGGIKRVAGSLAVTRALGDAYLKTPLLSFLPYKSHAPYITGRPEVNCRPLVKDSDKVLVLATDGVWERASGEDILRWVRNFYEERVAEAERRRRLNLVDKSSSNEDNNGYERPIKNSQETSERDLFEKNDADIPPSISNTASRKHPRSSVDQLPARSPSPPAKRRKRGCRAGGQNSRISYNVADVIVRRVLNKVRRARNISSLQALMSLPQGRARRSKHDDITASVVDLSAFVS